MSAHAVIERVISAPSAQIFDLVHDYHRRLEWDTLLRAAYTIDDAQPDVGVESVCTARRHLGGFSFRTRYITFRRPDLAAVTLVRPTLMFAAWTASIRHQSVGAATLVRYTLTFRCRPAFLARIIEPIAVRAFRIETRRRLAALDRFLQRS